MHSVATCVTRLTHLRAPLNARAWTRDRRSSPRLPPRHSRERIYLSFPLHLVSKRHLWRSGGVGVRASRRQRRSFECGHKGVLGGARSGALDARRASRRTRSVNIYLRQRRSHQNIRFPRAHVAKRDNCLRTTDELTTLEFFNFAMRRVRRDGSNGVEIRPSERKSAYLSVGVRLNSFVVARARRCGVAQNCLQTPSAPPMHRHAPRRRQSSDRNEIRVHGKSSFS